jgi:hypothetical protein
MRKKNNKVDSLGFRVYISGVRPDQDKKKKKKAFC